MTTQHTPGPWRVEKALHQAGCFFVEPFGYQQRKTEEEYAANARLIAAAPTLLAVVEFLHEWVEQGSGVVYLDALFDNDDVTLRQAIRAAIETATSEEK
jgi:hypothetical protein